MLTGFIEEQFVKEQKKFAPHLERTQEKVDKFIEAISFSPIEKSGVSPEILAECQKNSTTQERTSLVRGEQKYTSHGLGNNVSLLQIYNSDEGRVQALWYLDFVTGQAMELVSGLSQFDLHVFAREGTYSQTGKQEFSHDTFGHCVYVPGEEIDPKYFSLGDQLDVVATMSAAPAHEIGHALAELDSKFNPASDRFDLAREFIHKLGHHRLHPGSSGERTAMKTAIQVADAAHKHGVQLWRGYPKTDVLDRINKILHW